MTPDGPSGFVPDPRVNKYPGTYIRDWIMLCPEISDAAYRAYSIIRAHIWEKDETREVHLTQAQIGEMISKSEERTRKVLKPLLAVGLLEIAEKREWYEYNPRLKRQERRTMNIYAVMDFPAPNYEGPTSVSDFRARFASQSKPDRSKTTGRAANHVSAGQADRSKTTTSEVKNDRPYKKPFQEQEGEEGDARARVTGDPSADGDPQWGVAGGAHFVAPTLASANLIREIAGKVLLPGEDLSVEDHQRLAALVEAVRPVVDAQPGLSWEEYVAWLHQGWVRPDGRRKFTTLPGALGWRLQPEQVRGHAWGWACEQRGAQESSEAHGDRELPGGGVQQHTTTCGQHGTRLTDEGRCVRCEAENTAPQPRQPEAVDTEPQEMEELSPDEFAAMMELPLEQPKESREEILKAAREKIAKGADAARSRG